jgi:ATP-binding cassette subfamily A (ABC1) protein 3
MLKDNDGGAPYLSEGFLEVQNAIERSFISLTSKEEQEIPELIMQRYPYPAFLQDPVLLALEAFLPLLMLLSYLFVTINNIKVEFYFHS